MSFAWVASAVAHSAARDILSRPQHTTRHLLRETTAECFAILIFLSDKMKGNRSAVVPELPALASFSEN